MKKINETNDSEVIRLIKRDESHKSYFFKRVSEKRWYFKLKGENFFDIKEIPGPVISEDGGASFPGWLPFTYFEKLSKNLKMRTARQVHLSQRVKLKKKAFMKSI